MNELLKSSENLVSQFSLIISPNHSRVEITRTEYSCFIYTHVYNFARRLYDCKSTILYCATLIKFHYILVSTQQVHSLERRSLPLSLFSKITRHKLYFILWLTSIITYEITRKRWITYQMTIFWVLVLKLMASSWSLAILLL